MITHKKGVGLKVTFETIQKVYTHSTSQRSKQIFEKKLPKNNYLRFYN